MVKTKHIDHLKVNFFNDTFGFFSDYIFLDLDLRGRSLVIYYDS